MMDLIIEWLAVNEPLLSALVGLLSLSALAWGLARILYKRPLTTEKEPNPKNSNFNMNWLHNFLAPIVNLGIEHYVQIEDRIAARAVSVGTVAVMIISTAMIIFSLSDKSVFPLAFAHVPAFLLCLVALYLQSIGKLSISRWLILGIMMLDWSSSHILVGPWRGNEYVLPAIVMFPILVFSRKEIGLRALSLTAIAMIAVTTATLRTYLEIPPLLIPEATHEVGYHVLLVVVALGVFFVINYYVNFSVENFSELELEKLHTDQLVNSIFPEEVLRRLDQETGAIAKFHEEASVAFITISGFEDLYHKVSAVQLVEILSDVFVKFDELLVAHGVEKINTLGTHYVAATGVFDKRHPDHEALARFTLDAMEAVELYGKNMRHNFSLRAGISTGHVVSGILGGAHPSFDIWGQTVQMANELQDTAMANTIMVNAAAYWRLREVFDFAEMAAGEEHYLLLRARAQTEPT